MAVKIISHRGANRLAPQNTLPAFEAALKIGVDGFETDVHLTADGIPVICHNYKVNETSDGTGRISTMTYDEFKSYDFGGYFSPEFKGTTAPSLDEFLRLCLGADLEIINIELKPSLENDMSVVSKTIQMVKDYGLSDKLLISSFSSKMLLEAKKADKQCRTAYLYSPDKREAHSVWHRAAEFAKEIGACALHPNKCYVTKEYVKKAHNAGIAVNVWTVNKVKEMKKFIEMGVGGLITGCPDIAKSLIEQQ